MKLMLNNRIQILFMIIMACAITNVYAMKVEKIHVDEDMAQKILLSPFKYKLRNSQGKQLEVYLYAEDEKEEFHETFSCNSGESKSGIIVGGHFYIYLYDKSKKSFSNYRTAIFFDFDGIYLYKDGSDIIFIPETKDSKGEALLISQFGTCYTTIYEAYGFSDKEDYLINYIFHFKEDLEQMSGTFYNEFENNYLYGFFYPSERKIIHLMKLTRSKRPYYLDVVEYFDFNE